MRRVLAAGIILGLLALTTDDPLAQSSRRISGYYEHQFSGSQTDYGWTQLDSDRLRIDLDVKAGRDTRASAAVVWQRFSSSNSALRDFLPFGFDTLGFSSYMQPQENSYLNHCNVTIKAGPTTIVAGKQYLAWGAAWVFNPTELFRPKNAFEPSYEREGVGAISVSLPLGDLSDVQAVFVPEASFKRSGKLVRVRHHIAGFDLSAMAAEIWEVPVSEGLRIPWGNRKKRFTLGGDVSGELLGAGIWAEAAWSDQDDLRWMDVTVGGNYTLGDGTLLLLEGYYNGRGSSDEPYEIGSKLARATGLMKTLGKTTLYGSVTRPTGDLWNLGLSSIVNTGDQSAALIPIITYAFAQDVDLMFNGLVCIGREGAEYGADIYGGFIRGRVYF